MLALFARDFSHWMATPHTSTLTVKQPTLRTNRNCQSWYKPSRWYFTQYHRHPESKSTAPDGSSCNADSAGLLKRYPVTATGFHLIGKETERGWEQNDDISTIMPSLVRYGLNSGIADERLRQRVLQIPLAFLERETGLSRHTILRARRGQPVHSVRYASSGSRFAQFQITETGDDKM